MWTNHELFKLNSSERFFLGNLIEVQPSERHNPLIEHWISDKANDSTFQDYVVKKKIVKSVHGNVTIRVNKRLLHVFLIMMSLNSHRRSFKIEKSETELRIILDSWMEKLRIFCLAEKAVFSKIIRFCYFCILFKANK